MPRTVLTVGIGDIHGRFHRVMDWLAELERNRGRAIDLALAVGDVEAFLTEPSHQRKAAKKMLPAEYVDFVQGALKLHPAFHFIGGNNEDFESLHAMQSGGTLAGGAHYLGRSGVTELAGLRVAFLSGIYAPKHFEEPLRAPRTVQTRKWAGYFRGHDTEKLHGVGDVELMVVHEWPRGLVHSRKEGPPLRAYRFPWIGNPHARQLVLQVKPRWLWCGHSHVPYATSLGSTLAACLDQATRPEGAVFWLEWEGRNPVRGGWGVSGEVSWTPDAEWNDLKTPREEAEPAAGLPQSANTPRSPA